MWGKWKNYMQNLILHNLLKKQSSHVNAGGNAITNNRIEKERSFTIFKVQFIFKCTTFYLIYLIDDWQYIEQPSMQVAGAPDCGANLVCLLQKKKLLTPTPCWEVGFIF
jgi:hypothetical protein